MVYRMPPNFGAPLEAFEIVGLLIGSRSQLRKAKRNIPNLQKFYKDGEHEECSGEHSSDASFYFVLVQSVPQGSRNFASQNFKAGSRLGEIR